MSEALLKEIDPLFEDSSLIEKFKASNRKISNKALAIAIRELSQKPELNKINVLDKILNEVEDESMQKAAIQELVRLKSSDLRTILANYLLKNQSNNQVKIEAIRALGKASIRNYLNRK